MIELVKFLAGTERNLPTEDKDQASALDFLKSVSEFGSTGEGWEGVVAAAEKLKDKPWFRFKTKLPPKDQLRRMLNVSEKQAVLENVRCPLLALFWELDRMVMTEESVVRMEKMLKQSRHEDHTIKVFPKAGHNLMVAETGVLPIDLRRLRPAPVPGAYEMMIDWILKRVSVSR